IFLEDPQNIISLTEYNKKKQLASIWADIINEDQLITNTSIIIEKITNTSMVVEKDNINNSITVVQDYQDNIQNGQDNYNNKITIKVDDSFSS
ncbi:21257_t:CDS:2, partial [Dentiscutata erythropus]